MAKSLRNKRAKTNRSLQRVKYAKRELIRLKDVVKIREVRETVEKLKKEDNPLLNKVDANTIANRNKPKKPKELATLPKSSFNIKTLTDKHGKFAPWISQRNRRKLDKKDKDKLRKKKQNFKNSLLGSEKSQRNIIKKYAKKLAEEMGEVKDKDEESKQVKKSTTRNRIKKFKRRQKKRESTDNLIKTTNGEVSKMEVEPVENGAKKNNDILKELSTSTHTEANGVAKTVPVTVRASKRQAENSKNKTQLNSTANR